MSNLLQIVRPVLFESKLCDDSLEGVYWGCGTSFLASYKNHCYFITAAHVMKNQSACANDLRIFPTDDSYLTIPFNSQCELKPWIFQQEYEYHDLHILRVDLTMHITNTDSTTYTIDLNRSITSSEILPIGTKLRIIGFPSDSRKINYDLKNITYKRSVINAQYEGRSFDHCHKLKISDNLSHACLDGMSGSPVFSLHEVSSETTPKPKLVGIMIRGNGTSGKGHFISALVLKKALDLMA